MPVYLSPGVYVEEVPLTPPISGVGTSTAAFIGAVAVGVDMPPTGTFQTDVNGDLVLDGNGDPIPIIFALAPPGEPQLVTSFDQFKNKFGNVGAGNSTLAHAVFGFFNNGGTRCFVTRILDLTDATQVGDALKKLEAIDEVAIVAAPGALQADEQLLLIEHCENMKDRFAILDGQVTTTIDVPSIKGTVRFSDYAAMYFPRIQVIDMVTGNTLFQPPSGHMAGIYARVDTERGVHKAPANEVVRGALGLERLVSKNEQDGLNPQGINVIRNLNGGIRVWGARTLGGNTNEANAKVKYINVRRLLIFLEESIDEGTQFVVFEPNNPALWQKITRTVRAFLTNVWRDGALFGVTPEQAFYVKCDETTNPPELRELGQVITEIGVAIVKPAEFVIFRITQLTGSATV
jgi:phage tail sheath protein FI